jgi:hypothetical protein
METQRSTNEIVRRVDRIGFSANVLEIVDLTLQSAANRPLIASQLGGLCSVLHYLQQDTNNVLIIERHIDDKGIFAKHTHNELAVENDWPNIEAKIKDGRWTIENIRYYQPPEKSNKATIPAGLLLKEANNRLTNALDYLSGTLTNWAAFGGELSKEVVALEDTRYIRVVLQSAREGLRACCFSEDYSASLMS